MREVLFYILIFIFSIRITPACAGSTVQLLVCPATHEDHPRMCGKYFKKDDTRYVFKGSPPHVREVLQNVNNNNIWKGITPACAGSTFFLLVKLCILQDHPRMCGKYSLKRAKANIQLGSPPHVREVLPS